MREYGWVMHVWDMSHINDSYNIWMSHVTCEWIMAQVDGARSLECMHSYVRVCVRESEEERVLINHVTYESCHTWLSRITREWVMSHTNEFCHRLMVRILECMRSHVRERERGRTGRRERESERESTNESSHTWDMSQMNESYHTCMSHTFLCIVIQPTISSEISTCPCVMGWLRSVESIKL